MATTNTAAAAATIIAAATNYTNASAVFMDGPSKYNEKLHVHPPMGELGRDRHHRHSVPCPWYWLVSSSSAVAVTPRTTEGGSVLRRRDRTLCAKVHEGASSS
jgi:hypothetical protein